MEFSGSAAEEQDLGNQKVSIAAPLEIRIPDERGGDGSSFGVPQPLDCLQGSPVPPFLSKTYDLVDDPALDGIISWGASGESFVVWDPIDFSRIVLPRNFKHNNFSSFVRQLNTYRFRKIDTDKWEFANKGFIRGKKHLLKSIQRRKSPQSQQDSYFGTCAEAGRPGLDEEVERLKKERKMLMHEVAELQIMQDGTAHHMQLVNQRIHIAEKKQKQMVTFLSRMFQNPAILARLKSKMAPNQIESPKMKRKFITQHPHEAGGSCQNANKERAKSLPEQIKPCETSIMIENPSVSIPQLPGCLLEDLVGRIDGGGETNPAFMKKDFLVTELPTSKELEELDEFIMIPEDMDAMLTDSATRDSVFKGKGKVDDLDTPSPDYLVSFPEDICMEKAYHRFSNSGTQSSLKHEDVWSMGFDANMVMSNPSNSLWDNVADCNMPEFGASSSISDAWEFSTMHAAGCAALELGSPDECTFDELDIQVDQTEDGATKYMDN